MERDLVLVLVGALLGFPIWGAAALVWRRAVLRAEVEKAIWQRDHGERDGLL